MKVPLMMHTVNLAYFTVIADWVKSSLISAMLLIGWNVTCCFENTHVLPIPFNFLNYSN